MYHGYYSSLALGHWQDYSRTFRSGSISKILGPSTEVYKLKGGFVKHEYIWIGDTREESMNENANVLYRPKVVNELVQHLEQMLESDFKGREYKGWVNHIPW